MLCKNIHLRNRNNTDVNYNPIFEAVEEGENVLQFLTRHSRKVLRVFFLISNEKSFLCISLAEDKNGCKIYKQKHNLFTQ